MRPAVPSRALVRMAITGIYLVRSIPREVQRAARVRAASDGTTLRRVLVHALREYAAGTWTPQPEAKVLEAKVLEAKVLEAKVL